MAEPGGKPWSFFDEDSRYQRPDDGDDSDPTAPYMLGRGVSVLGPVDLAAARVFEFKARIRHPRYVPSELAQFIEWLGAVASLDGAEHYVVGAGDIEFRRDGKYSLSLYTATEPSWQGDPDLRVAVAKRWVGPSGDLFPGIVSTIQGPHVRRKRHVFKGHPALVASTPLGPLFVGGGA